jgi:hypothetical protein
MMLRARIRRRTFQITATAAVLGAVAAGSFFAVRALTGGSGPAAAEGPQSTDLDYPAADVTPIPGTTPDTSQPWWYVPYLNAEKAKMPFEGTINGITVTVADVAFDRECDEFDYGDLSVADETALGIHATYMPEGATIDPITGYLPVVICDGEPVSSQLSITVTSNPREHRYGGTIRIYRYYNSQSMVSAQFPEYRWSPGEIDGNRAIFARPIFPDIGTGGTLIGIDDGPIMTTVFSDSIPFEEVRKVAEGLYR